MHDYGLGRDARLARPLVGERTSGPLVPTFLNEHFLLRQPVHRRGFCIFPAEPSAHPDISGLPSWCAGAVILPMTKPRAYPSFLTPLAAALAASLLSGCASVSLVQRDWKVTPVPVPEVICVRPFTAELGAAKVDRDGAELDAFAREFGAEAAGRLVERLGKHVGPAKVIGVSERVTNPRHWILEGRFVRMKQGSRALRSIVGFGLGGTRLETVVDIYRIDPRGRRQALAHFQTTGGSNAEPGALFSSPLGLVPRLAVSATASGLAADARRTSRMITAAIAEKLASQGVKLAGRPLRAKELSAEARARLE